MKREITIHRALAQLKTTTSRIDDLISNGRFIDTTMGKSGTSHGTTIENCKKELQSNYDSVTKLINNYQEVKLSIIRANSGINDSNESSIDKVDILGTRMTVSEMLCIHTYIIPLHKKLLKAYDHQYRAAMMKVEQSQALATSQLTNMISQMSNSSSTDDKQLTKETIEQISQAYRDNNCISAVDPLDLLKVINNLKKYIEDFEEACDATLSEQNSIKKITIDFDD